MDLFSSLTEDGWNTLKKISHQKDIRMVVTNDRKITKA